MIEPICSPDVTYAQMQALTAMMTPLTVDAVPVEGGTVTLPNTSQEIILNLAPATDLTNVNLVLPNDASSRQGQRIFVASTRQIGNLVASGVATVNNATVMFSPGDNVVFFKNRPNTWSRLIG